MISKKVPPAWSLPKKDLKTTIFPIFLFAQKQIGSMGAVQNIGNCTKFWEMYKILWTEHNFRKCTNYCELHKILGTEPYFGKCTKYWELNKVLEL